MNPKYQKLIKYNDFIKLKLENRFVYSSFDRFIKIVFYKITRLGLFFLKIYAILINPFLKKIDSEICDILVFPNSKNHLNRSKTIWEILENKGYKIIYFNKNNRYLTKFIFKYKVNFDKNVPYKVFFHHAFARYLTQKYKFKVICDYHNFEVSSAFIKQELKDSQKSIFIPHGKIRNSYRHSCFTFDYYFVFGKSSVEKIKENKFRHGNTRVIKAGSAFIPPNFNRDVCTNFKNILFFSNWAISYHPESKRGFEIVLNWAKLHPEYNLYIRLHPLEDGKYIKQQTLGIKNIIVQDKSLSLKQSLENISLTIATGSNASIEAALLNIPSVVVLDKTYIKDSEDVFEADSNFYIESFFPKRAKNADELNNRISQVYENYSFYLQQCKKYVEYHLEYTSNASKFIAETIDKIYKDKIDFPYIEIKENIKI